MDAHPSENENNEQFLQSQYEADIGAITGIPEYPPPNSFDEEYYNSLYASMDAHPPENGMWFDEPPIIEANLYPYPQEFHPSEKETEASLRIEWSDRYKQALDLMYGSKNSRRQRVGQKTYLRRWNYLDRKAIAEMSLQPMTWKALSHNVR
ncbi:hypothetical protein [Ruminococcus sp.]|uniref:hypothetical protein n=1 Tax=Ruminococcus sp. TaxID=41978 RepID=UPI0039A30E4D